MVDKEAVTCVLNLRSHYPALIDAGLPDPSGPCRDGAEASSRYDLPHGDAAKAPQLNYLAGNRG